MFEETQIFIGRWLRHVGQIERDRPDAGEPHFLDPDDASSTCTTISTTSATDYASTSTTTTTSTRDDARRPFPNLQDICPPVLEKCLYSSRCPFPGHLPAASCLPCFSSYPSTSDSKIAPPQNLIRRHN